MEKAHTQKSGGVRDVDYGAHIWDRRVVLRIAERGGILEVMGGGV